MVQRGTIMSGDQMIGDPGHTQQPVPQPVQQLGSQLDHLYREPQQPIQRQEPRPVATSQQPVVSIDEPRQPVGAVPYDISDIQGMDMSGLRNYTNYLQTRLDMGEPLTEEEMYRARVASDRLAEERMATMSQDTMQPVVDQAQARLSQREQELRARDEGMISAQEQRTRAQLDRQFAEAERMVGQRKEATQAVLSLSGFGRSTFAAEKQDEIQRELNMYMQTAEEIRQANMDIYRMQLEGRTGEELAMMNERVSELMTQQAMMNREMANQINMYNAEVAGEYQERLSNIMQMSQAMVQSQQPLSDMEMSQAMAFASLMIDHEGNVNDKVMAAIPERLQPYAMMMGAELKAQTPPPMQFQSVSAGQTILDGQGNVVFQAPQTGNYQVGGNMEDGLFVFDKDSGQFTYMGGPKREPSRLANDPTLEYNVIDPISLETASQLWSEQFAEGDPGTRNGWCGEFVNDYLRGIGVAERNLFLDPLRDKMQVKNSDRPQVGAIAIMSSPTDPEYGHVGIVRSVNGDGTVTIQSSNMKGDRTVSTDVIPQSGILGYFDPSISSVSVEDFDLKEYTNVRQISRNNVAVLDSAEKLVRDATDVKNMLNDRGILSMNAMTRSTMASIPGTQMYQVQSAIDSVKSNIGIDKLLEIKASGAGLGNVTENQLDELQSVLGRLDIKRRPDLLLRDIEEIIEKYEDILDEVATENAFLAKQFPQFAKPLGLEKTERAEPAGPTTPDTPGMVDNILNLYFR